MTAFGRLNPVTGEVASSAEAMQSADIAAITAKAQQMVQTRAERAPRLQSCTRDTVPIRDKLRLD